MTNIMRIAPSSTNMTPTQAVSSALADAESGYLTDVLIIGYSELGGLYVRSSKLTCAEALFLANKAMKWAEPGGQI